MGLCFHARGLAYGESYDAGDIAYGHYRMELAKAVDPLLGRLYWIWYTNLGEREFEGRPHFENVMFLADPGSIADLVEAGFLRVEGVFGGPGSAAFHGDYSVHVLLDWKRFRRWADGNVPGAVLTFLFASDTAGEWSPEECRDMHGALSGYEVDITGCNYAAGAGERFNMHDRFMSMMLRCWTSGEPLRWG